MPKQRKRRPPHDTAALFVRLPVEEAEKLDRMAFERKVPKRELIRTLIARDLDPMDMDVMFHRRLPPPGSGLVVGHAAPVPTGDDDVLTPSEAAELLQAQETAVIELAEAGELPGRKVGGEWRFLRRAVLDWLAAAG